MMVKEKHDKDNVRLVNTLTVLNALRLSETEMSRPDLANRVGLSKVTIASIIRELNQQGYTSDAGMGLPDYRGGRKPQLVALNKEGKRIVNTLISSDRLIMVLTDITGRELSRLRSSSGYKTDANELTLMFKQLLIGADVNQSAIIGFILTFDDSYGFNENSVDFQTFSQKKLASSLEGQLNVPILNYGIAKSRAFAERWYNSDFNKPSDFFYLNLDMNLEAIYTKMRAPAKSLPGFASCFLKHSTFEKDAQEALTVESILSGRIFLKKAAEVFARKLELKELIYLAERSDEKSLKLFEEYGQQLGYALSLAVNIREIQHIIIGGFMAEAWPFFFNSLSSSLEKYTHYEFRKNLSVVPLRKDLEDGLMGTLALALDKLVYFTDLLPPPENK